MRLRVCPYVFPVVVYTATMTAMGFTELFPLRPIFFYVALCAVK